MALGKRMYWILALVAVMALAGAAITVTSRITSAGGPTPAQTVQPCDQDDDADDALESASEEADDDAIEDECGDQNEADDAIESTAKGPDTDNIEEQTGDQNEADDSTGQHQSGVLDDGKDLLPQAQITVGAAIAAAQSAASGQVGEVDLEHYQGKLVFNVDVGDKDVKVDAANGSVLTVDSDD